MAKRRPSGDGMVRKRDDGRWEGRIVVGHKENGEPIFQYALAPTQKVLLAKLHQNIEMFRDVELNEDSRMTLAQWLDRWLDEYAAPRLRESTMSSYRMYAGQYIKPRLGDKKMNAITPVDIQRMYIRLQKEGRVHEHPELGHELSASTIHRIHTMLHRALGDAVQAHVIPRNPAEGLTLPKADITPRRVLTDKELDTFMEVIKTDPVWHGFFYTELTTGLRRGEICTHALASGVDAKTLAGILGHTDATFTLNTYTHVTGDMQRQASAIVENFMQDIFGEELKPWQNAESAATAASV